jgi:hypothetical protein
MTWQLIVVLKGGISFPFTSGSLEETTEALRRLACYVGENKFVYDEAQKKNHVYSGVLVSEIAGFYTQLREDSAARHSQAIERIAKLMEQETKKGEDWRGDA